MDAQQILDELHGARIEHDLQKKLVLDEMDERARAMQLWTNEQCAAWSEYKAALTKLRELRDKYAV